MESSDVRLTGSRRGVLLGAMALGLAAGGAQAAVGGGAVDAPTQYVEVGGRRLAYRSVGAGRPMVLCTRFRGTLDDWDPLFLDSVAGHGFRVITFDYSGLGLSTGEKTINRRLGPWTPAISSPRWV